ncbi:MAG: TonB-dependent receptor plug domain-containing protein [Gemmatimonadales bacterium]
MNRIGWFVLAPVLLAPRAAQPQGDTVTLEPVVVTATRVPVSAGAVASAVTVLRGAELRARGLTTVAQALRAVPGATVVETGSFGGQTALFLRGGESDYVKVLLDGVPLNQPGGAFDFADLTLDNVDRIEVLNGPASVLYGSDAVTGVVQIFTRAGTGAPRVEAEARAGTYGTTDLAAQVAGGTRLVGYSAALSRFGSDGLYAYNNGYRNTTVSGRLRVAPDARSEVGLAYRYGDNVYHFPTDGAGRPVDSNQVSTGRGPAASLSLHRLLGAGVDVRALATWREQRAGFLDEPDSPGEDGRFQSGDLVRRASAGALVSWRGGAGTMLSLGVEYEDERQHGRSLFEASFGSFPDSIDVGRWNRAAYAQAMLGLGPAVTANVGVRVEDNSQFGGHATWRVGAVWRLDDATRLRAAAGTGFKEPTFFENFARGFVRGNPDLDPERSASWEAGLEHQVHGVTLAATYFRQRFRDLIEFTFTPVPPDSVNYFNVAGARAEGVELSLEAALGAGVTAGLGYAYLDTRVLDAGLDGGPDGLFVAGASLLRRPAHALSGHVRVSPGERTFVTLDARLVGARDDLDFSRAPGDRRVTLGPSAGFDAAAEWVAFGSRSAGPELVLTLRVENVTDDDGRQIANFPPRGRTLLFGARITLGT